MAKLRKELVEARDKVAVIPKAAGHRSAADGDAVALVDKLQERMGVLQAELLQLQQRLASKDAVPKQVGLLHS